jgi:hypothetical protein
LEEMEMNDAAYLAIEEAWKLTVKARVLCPIIDDSAIGMTGYISPLWYQAHGATYFANLAKPLTAADVEELRQIGSFVSRSFVISMVAILKEYRVVPYNHRPDCSREGSEYVLLTKWLRNRFGHGEWQYDVSKQQHRETRELLKRLFPEVASGASGFVTSIDGILDSMSAD